VIQVDVLLKKRALDQKSPVYFHSNIEELTISWVFFGLDVCYLIEEWGKGTILNFDLKKLS